MKPAFFTVLAAVVLGLVACSPPAQAPHPDEVAILQFLNRYFSTWSAQDMEGYGASFVPEARVCYVDKNGGVSSEGLTDFLHGQKLSHQRSSTPMKEVPTTIQISGDNLVAQAAVAWQLTKADKTETGLDYFTLRKGADGWKIVSLVFYQH